MKDRDFMHAMATWADAEARATASMVELVAAAVLVQTRPPSGDEVISVTLDQTALGDTLKDFHFETRYADGRMTLLLTRLLPPGN